jgi:hypothetical protein
MEGRGWLSSVIGTRSRTVGQSQKRNSKVFDIISELRPKCSSTKMKKNEEKKNEEKKQAAIQNSPTTSLYINLKSITSETL